MYQLPCTEYSFSLDKAKKVGHVTCTLHILIPDSVLNPPLSPGSACVRKSDGGGDKNAMHGRPHGYFYWMKPQARSCPGRGGVIHAGMVAHVTIVVGLVPYSVLVPRWFRGPSSRLFSCPCIKFPGFSNKPSRLRYKATCGSQTHFSHLPFRNPCWPRRLSSFKFNTHHTSYLLRTAMHATCTVKGEKDKKNVEDSSKSPIVTEYRVRRNHTIIVR